jgi:hypothetical protein
VYDQDSLIKDGSGYGLVIYAAHEGGITWASANWTAREPFLGKDAADTFLGSRYVLVKSTRPLTIYRFHGVSAMAEARLLGSYWTPARPAMRIDRLGYPAMHDSTRSDIALKRAWNPMTEVVEASLERGSWIFVGRAAPQREGDHRFGGGSIQFVLPETGHRLNLQRGYRG